jgi:phosphoglycerate dehydrogenase-like enzyme
VSKTSLHEVLFVYLRKYLILNNTSYSRLVRDKREYKQTKGLPMGKGKRVGIVGAGNVGSTAAFILAMNGSCHEFILRDNKIDIA